jgi:geranylgeranyl pyrophosphate synthase
MRLVLEQQGKLLCPLPAQSASSTTYGQWALLPLLIIRDLNSSAEYLATSAVAIAVECLICALDLLDDVEDGDQTQVIRQLGIARTLNVSTTLLLLAQRTILSLSELGIPSEQIVALINMLQSATLDAAVGQHKDIFGEQQPLELVTEEDCIQIARGKAGSLMRLACVIGCVFAQADVETCELFAEFGELLGIAHQLDNDSHDMYNILHSSEGELVKTDLERGKKTLPLVLAAKAARDVQNTQISSTIETEQQEGFKNFLDESIITTWGISLLYLERARDVLRKIEAKHRISPEFRLLLGFT